MSNQHSDDGWSLDRRTLLRSTAAASAAGVVGLPAFSGGAVAQDGGLDIACELDVMCAVDASGSLDSDDVGLIQSGVNGFVDELEASSGDIRVGSLQFAGGDITRLNGLQAPGDLTVTVDDPGGDTPMPGALDIADQILYNDAGQRDDADKLIVLFTDGGPNYETKWSDPINYSVSLNGSDYDAPRDQTTDWSAVGGNDVYDNDNPQNGRVSEGEMDETAGVAGSIRDVSVGGGATEIAAIYIDLANDLTNAMTSDAISTYTDLPTYLENYIASSSELFLKGESAEDIASLGSDLADTLETNCCDECPEGLYYKYEWVEDEEVEDGCAGEFVVYDGDDSEVESVEGLDLVSVACDDDGEPVEACFETDYCGVEAVVKAGSGYEVSTYGELLANGSFEEPVVQNDDPGWSAFDSQQVPGWDVSGGQLEVQRSVNGWEHDDGDQHVELDGYKNVAVSQSVDATAGEVLDVSYAWSPRPEHGDNELTVTWNGDEINSHSADGSSNQQTEWTTETVQVTATGGTDTLAFAETGTEDTKGMFLDDVSVQTTGALCVTGIEGENPGGETVTYAISNIRFYCEAPDDPSVGNSGDGGPAPDDGSGDGAGAEETDGDHDRGHGNDEGEDPDNPGGGEGNSGRGQGRGPSGGGNGRGGGR